LSVIGDLFGFITSGTIAGLPVIVLMLIPLVLGLIVGFLFHKFLKIAIVAAVIIVVVAYLGFFGLSLSALGNLATTYGPMVIQYGTLLIGLLPLGIGFIIGFIVGFVLSK
jgi:uncharacterized membrane protein (Fun14 family)